MLPDSKTTQCDKLPPLGVVCCDRLEFLVYTYIERKH